jgi:hypothetical protein
VCAVAGFLNKNAEEYVDDCYMKERYLKTYQFTIPPMASERYWPSITCPLDPPPIKIAPGRPKKTEKEIHMKIPKNQENWQNMEWWWVAVSANKQVTIRGNALLLDKQHHNQKPKR